MMRVLTVAEAAAYLRVSRATMWRWCQAQRVPATKIGHEWRIDADGLRVLVTRRPAEPAPQAPEGA
jgi:excisionase family DNA binding protein